MNTPAQVRKKIIVSRVPLLYCFLLGVADCKAMSNYLLLNDDQLSCRREQGLAAGMFTAAICLIDLAARSRRTTIVAF